MSAKSTIDERMASISIGNSQGLYQRFLEVCTGVRGVDELHKLIADGLDLKKYAVRGIFHAMDKDNLEVFQVLVEIPHVKEMALRDDYKSDSSFFKFGVTHNSVMCLRHLYQLGGRDRQRW